MEMRSYEQEYKRMLEKQSEEVESFEKRKALWEAAVDFTREWPGSFAAGYDMWWITLYPDGEKADIELFKNLMYKYFHHNPRFKVKSPTGTSEDSSSIGINVVDTETDARFEINLNKRGLTSCEVIEEHKMKEITSSRFICKGGEYS